MADILTLGGIAFDDFSTPSGMGAGGKQSLVVHKLPGGPRVIDLLGPDEDDITWNGEFFGDDAYTNALALDAMRAAGQVIPLVFGGQYRSVVIEHFTYKIRRLPVWVEYSVTCTVYQNPALGNLSSVSPGGVDSLVSSDLDAAASIASSEAQALANGTAAP
jgi:hypothetical protein